MIISRIGRIKLKYVYILVFFLSLLVISEGIVRVIYKQKFDRYLPSPLNYQPDSLLGFRFEPNTSFNVAGNTINVNSHGFLGEEFSTSKDSAKFRIVIVGSCVVSGVVSYQFYSNPCIYLQELFDKNDWNVEVLNLGLDGALRNYEMYNTVNYEAVKYSPDLIITESFIPLFSIFYSREQYRGYLIEYTYGSERLRNEAITRIDEQFSLNRRVVFFLYDHSYLLKAAHSYFFHRGYNIRLIKDIGIYYERKLGVNVSRPQYWTFEKSLEMLNDVKIRLDEKGVELIVFNCFKNDWLKSLMNNKLNYIHLLEPNSWDPEFEYFDSKHFSDKGNVYMANRFYDLLIEGNFIPENYRKSIK